MFAIVASRGHHNRLVGDLVRLRALRFHIEPLGALPVLALDDRSDVPVHVGAIWHHQVAGVFLADGRHKVQNVLHRGHRDAHARQRQVEGLLRALNGTFESLQKRFILIISNI